MVELVWACFALVCLITVSSLTLVKSLGDSLRDENGGEYQYRTRRRELRKEISKYPTLTSYVYFLMVFVTFLTFLDVGISSNANKTFLTFLDVGISSNANKIVIFSSASACYVVWILRRITKLCSMVFKDFSDDKYNFNSKE